LPPHYAYNVTCVCKSYLSLDMSVVL